MTEQTGEIVDLSGAVVISIATLREIRQERAKEGECNHHRVAIEPLAADLVCRDCKVRVNPIAWIKWAGSEWAHVRRSYAALKKEQARLDLRKWVVCRCGERIHLVGRTEDERRRVETRECRLEEALEQIRGLSPEAAAKYAAGIAAKAIEAKPCSCAGNTRSVQRALAAEADAERLRGRSQVPRWY